MVSAYGNTVNSGRRARIQVKVGSQTSEVMGKSGGRTRAGVSFRNQHDVKFPKCDFSDPSARLRSARALDSLVIRACSPAFASPAVRRTEKLGLQW